MKTCHKPTEDSRRVNRRLSALRAAQTMKDRAAEAESRAARAYELVKLASPSDQPSARFGAGLLAKEAQRARKAARAAERRYATMIRGGTS